MPSGKVHLISNIITGVGVVSASYIYFPEITTPVIIGSVIGTLITPDMDLEGTTITERLVRKVPVIGFIWQVSWYPYALLAVHRGLSHSVIFGTIGRALWLGVIGLLYAALTIGICHIFKITLPELKPIYIEYKFILIILATWFIQDVNHYILDKIPKKRKKRGTTKVYM